VPNLKTLVSTCLRYVTKIFPFSNSCIAKYVLVAMHVCSQYVRSHSGLLLPLDCCCHCANICNLQFAIMATCQKKKESPSQNFHHLCCFIHDLCSHLGNQPYLKQKWLVSIPLTIESLDESIINQIICNQVHISDTQLSHYQENRTLKP
jgi:hypothetical protein